MATSETSSRRRLQLVAAMGVATLSIPLFSAGALAHPGPGGGGGGGPHSTTTTQATTTTTQATTTTTVGGVDTTVFDPHLTRAPYLTDAVGTSMTISWGTDQSSQTGSVRWGAVVSGNCTPTNAVTGTWYPVTVNGVSEYQWTATVSLPAAGTYCYRPFLDTTDLLGSASTPTFTTQVPAGSTQPFSFDVFGDWGQTDANGNNADQANLMQQIAASGARFAVSVGDNGYPSGSQTNYGDLQQHAANVSAIFGPSFWPAPGQSLPLFPASGNHGIASSTGTRSTEQMEWPETVAAAASGGKYVKETYCCVNGTASASYPSSWYAFDAGNTRFYVLQADWADTNPGNSTVYADDYAAHWTPTSPEYQWLKADLAAHPSGLKFAFWHYPTYSDQKAQNSDTYLQGPSSLQGLLVSNGVNLGFTGHAHIYERNVPKGPNTLTTYVTGGGGGILQPVAESGCSNFDAYAIGWSPTNSNGSRCGSARVPDSATRVFHFLKVSVSGSQVTVTPTDELGRTFDVQTYSFNPKPETYIDSAPPGGTSSTSATFSFHASSTTATFKCSLDGATPTVCTSPVTYSGLAQGSHTFTVDATVGGVADPLPARATWTVDTSPPTAPTGLAAVATSPFSVALSWTAASDNLAVTGYDVFRDGTLLATVPATTTYVDSSVLGSSTHQYAVRARDVGGNVSELTPAMQVTTPPPPSPVFSDGFESGDLGAWTTASGLTVESATVSSGSFAAEGNTTNGATYAKRSLPSTYTDAYARVSYDLVAGASQVNLLRFRDTGGNSLGYLYIATSGQLGFHDDTTGTSTLSNTVPGPGWHALELHMSIAGPSGTVEVWLDNTLISDLSTTVDTGTSPVGAFQIGETQTDRTYDVVFDDAAFGTSRLGPAADTTAPSVPVNVTADATSPFSVSLAWDAATDDVGVTGYDVFRDGALLTSLGAVTSFTDDIVLSSSTYAYQVRARDASGNLSALSDVVSVTTPPASPPLFMDGFETGGLSAWTTSAGLTAEGTDVHSGLFAVEGNTTNGGTYAKVTLPGTYSDAFAQVAYEVKSQTSQVNLLRMRDATGSSIGYVYLTTTGRLAFHDDATGVNQVSAISPGAGWHTIQLHLGVDGAASTVEVWLDGALAPDLSGPATLGTQPVGILQIGETQLGLTYDVAFDDVSFGSQRLGPFDSTPPSAPASLSAVATSPFSVDLSWTPSTDDTGVTGYDVYRDGIPVVSVGAVTTFTDDTVFPATTYDYTVVARDGAGNTSPASLDASVTTPGPTVPVFADGFESGDLSAWTTSGGLVVEGADVHAGGFAAEGNTSNGATYAKETLATTYADGYGRVAFELKSQAAQVNLLRMRDASGTSIGYLYITTGGLLAFHDDATAANVVSGVAPGAGWHSVELHLAVNGASSTVEVWLDGALVTALSGPVTLGSSPIGIFQIGETQAGRIYDVVFDDAAFGTERLGP